MKRRVLLISPAPPTPPTAGNRQRTAVLLKALQRFGDVDFLLAAALEPGQRGGVEAACNFLGEAPPTPLGTQFPFSLLRGVNAQLANRLAHNLGSHARQLRPDPALVQAIGKFDQLHRYDFIVVRYLEIAARSGLLGDPRLIIDVDDLWTDKYGSRLEGEALSPLARFIVKRHYQQFAKLEPPILKQAAWLWYVSEKNRRGAPHERASVLPNIPHYDRQPQSPKSSPASTTALFIGTIGPIIFASLDRLVMEVWPRVRSRVPTARLRIVGRGMDDAWREKWTKVSGVEAVGFAESVEAEYRDCAITVVPMLTGSGTNIKVAESYRMGRACVATPMAHRGFEDSLLADRHILVREVPEAFAIGVAEMLLDPSRRDTMAAAGQRVIEERFSLDSFAAEVKRTLDQLTAREQQSPTATKS